MECPLNVKSAKVNYQTTLNTTVFKLYWKRSRMRMLEKLLSFHKWQASSKLYQSLKWRWNRQRWSSKNNSKTSLYKFRLIKWLKRLKTSQTLTIKSRVFKIHSQSKSSRKRIRVTWLRKKKILALKIWIHRGASGKIVKNLNKKKSKRS